MKKILLVSLFALATACIAADAPAPAAPDPEWTVSHTDGTTVLKFTVLPETVAVNSKKTMWRASVALHDGTGDPAIAHVVVTGCRTLAGNTAILSPDGTPPDPRNIISWSHKETTVASRLATLVCAAAYKVKLVSAQQASNFVAVSI